MFRIYNVFVVCMGDACKMHIWSLHFTTWYSTLFASYIGYIHAFFMIIGNNSHVPQFYWINLGKPENLFFNVFNFQDPNGVQITWNFAGASFSTKQDLGVKEEQ
jgi:hypothetical protein